MSSFFPGAPLILEDEDEREAFAALVLDDETRALVVDLAAEKLWPAESVGRGGVGVALRTYGILPPPRLLILDTSDGDRDTALDAVEELARLGSIVVVLGEDNTVDLFRRMLAKGAADYLAKPVDGDTLGKALARAEALISTDPARAQVRLGRRAVVLGSRGGVGVSTVAVDCAWLLASEFKRRTALVDLDLALGTIAVQFDIEPTQGLREAVEDPDRLDEVFIDRAMAKLGERLHVFADEVGIAGSHEISLEACPAVLEALAGHHDIVVADIPRHLAMERPSLLHIATDIVVVTDASLAGLRDSNRWIRHFKNAMPDCRVHLVVNRYRGRRGDLFSLRSMRAELEVAPAVVIPADERGTVTATKLGQPIAQAARKSRMVPPLRSLAETLSGTARARRSLWRRLIGR